MHRVRRGYLIAGILTAILFSSQPIRAQYAANFQTNIISGVVSNWVGNYFVGSNTFADALLVSGAGGLSNFNTYVGYEANSSNNTILITGIASALNVSNLYVGFRGPNNSLIISNGGQVVVAPDDVFAGSIGSFSSSSNNTVFVTGVGSVWNSLGALSVGVGGSQNRLTISEGAIVEDNLGYVTEGGGSNESVLVTDPGSVWSNRSGLCIGEYGGGNSLVISNGGQVLDSYANLGAYSWGNNTAVVSDTGSVWSNGTLSINGATNNLVIRNGGILVGIYFYVGYGTVGPSYSSYNTVLVTGTGSSWNADSVNVGYGGGLFNKVVVSNGAQVVTRFLEIGDNGMQNTMEVNDGGRVISGFCNVGSGSQSSSNNVLVSGLGSVWSNWSTLYVGGQGSRNSLVITNEGLVFNDVCYVGYYNNSNLMHVVDGGIWENHILTIGGYGVGNSVVIDYGFVSTTNLICGPLRHLPECSSSILRLDGGNLIVTNGTQDAVLEIRYGKLILNGGTLQVDRFVMTNACAQFVRTGGTLIYSTAVLDPNRDDDGDGIPNGWEQAHGLDPLNPADANVDSDGDGFTNLQEYLAGTDPQDCASAFRIIGIAPEGDDLRVTWMMGSGKTNALQSSAGDSGLYTNDFEDIFTVTNTIGSQTNYLDVGAATNVPGRFYRVRLVP